MTFLCQYIHSIMSSLAPNCCCGLAGLKMMLKSLKSGRVLHFTTDGIHVLDETE